GSWTRRVNCSARSFLRSFNQARSLPGHTCICRVSMIFLLKKCGILWGLTSPKFWRSNLMKIGRGENRVLIDIPGKPIFSTPLYAKMFNSTQPYEFACSQLLEPADLLHRQTPRGLARDRALADTTESGAEPLGEFLV